MHRHAYKHPCDKFALGLYFGKANPGTGYGAAGSIILIMLWVSYSSMIVFYGAEFTRAYAEMRDGKIVPTKDAVKVEEAKPDKGDTKEVKWAGRTGD